MCDCCISLLGTRKREYSGKSLQTAGTMNLWQFCIYLNMLCHPSFISTTWGRKHYDKSSLSFLSDCAYQCKYLPAYWAKKASNLKLIAEVWHFVLRSLKIKTALKILLNQWHHQGFLANLSSPQFHSTTVVSRVKPTLTYCREKCRVFSWYTCI